jgi:DNA-binding CsgD family transcriptional regulator
MSKGARVDGDAPALVLCETGGVVVAQNDAALRLLGSGLGRPCSRVVGALPGAVGLPCARDCVPQLFRGEFGALRHSAFSLRGQRRALTCIPVRGAIVCLVSGAMPAEPHSAGALTRREADVLRLLAEGKNTGAIAGALRVSEATVRTHVEHMRTKLGVRTRASLVALGFRLGLLD